LHRCRTCWPPQISARSSSACAAAAGGHGLVWGLGAHVIKTGLAPVLIDLMERGYVSALAMNGAVLIHDFEMALGGTTSEDVDAVLGPGRFGMAEETGQQLNEAVNQGAGQKLGLGQAVVAHLASARPKFAGVSLLCAAGRLQIPVSVHVGGTDITHMHPAASGEAIGAASFATSGISRVSSRASRPAST
jgi:hypothetical protein